MGHEKVDIDDRGWKEGQVTVEKVNMVVAMGKRIMSDDGRLGFSRLRFPTSAVFARLSIYHTTFQKMRRDNDLHFSILFPD